MSANQQNLAGTGQLLELLMTLKQTTPVAAKGILNAQPAIGYALISLMVSMGAIKLDVFQKTLAEYQANAAKAAVTPTPPLGQPAVAPAPYLAPPHLAASHSHSSSLSSTPAPIPAIPPHLQPSGSNYANPYRTATPPHSTPTPPIIAGPPPPQAPYGYPPPAVNNGYGVPPPGAYPPAGPPAPPAPSYHSYPGYPPAHHGTPPTVHPPAPAPAPPVAIPPGLAETLAAIPEDQKQLVISVISMTPDQILALPPQERATYVQIRATFGIPTPGA